MNLRLGITQKLTMLFVIFAALVLGGLGALAYTNGRAALEGAARSELLSKSADVEAALSNRVNERLSYVVSFARTPSLVRYVEALRAATPGSPEAAAAHNQLVGELLPRTGADQPFLALLIVATEDAQVIAASSPGEEGKYKETLPYFIHGLDGPYVQNFYYSTAIQGPAMTVAAPVYAEDGRVLAVLAGRLRLDELSGIVRQRTGLRQSDDAFLVGSSKLFVTQPRLFSDINVLQGGIHTEAVERCLTRSSGIVFAPDFREIPTIVAYRWLPERAVCLIVKVDEAEILAPVYAFGRTLALVGVLVLLTASILAFFFARSFTSPILALIETSRRIGRGELGVHASETAQDELGELARAFNQMADSLSERSTQLRARLERYYNYSNNLIAVANFTGFFVELNPAWLTKLGYSTDELAAQPYMELIHPEDREATQAKNDDLMQGIADVGSIVRYRHKNGTWRWLQWERTPDPSAELIYATAQDITAQIEAEEDLRTSEAKLRALFGAMPDLILELDGEGNIQEIAPTGTNPHYKLPGDKVGKPVGDLLPPDLSDEALGWIIAALQTGETVRGDYNLTLAGSEVYFSASVSPMGQDRVLWVARDITERRQAEDALKAVNQRFALATRAAAMGVWEFDIAEGQLIWDNQMFRLYGIQPDKFSGAYDAWVQGVHPDDRERGDEEVRQAISGEKEFDTQFRVVWPDATIRHIKGYGHITRDGAGKPLRMIGVNYDITDQKTAEERLNKSMQDLATSNAELEQFAYVASHDLQEPLRIVSSYVQLLARRYSGKLDADANEFIQYAVDGVNRMKTLINDLLTFSRVGSQNKEFTAIDLNEIAELVKNNLALLSQEQKAVISFDKLPTIQGDRTQMLQLLQNLVGNGLKFNTKENPTVHVSAQARWEEWLFCVEDNGIGLQAEFAERIFIIFQRLHGREEYPGTGIGLSICKKIVNRHGGRIWVESEVGHGAKFFFTLPAPGFWANL